MIDLILYVPVNNFSVMLGGAEMLVRLQHAAPRSRVRNSTTEPLFSLEKGFCIVIPR